MEYSKLARAIEQAALDCGFDKCGIISPSALSDYHKRLEERIAKVPNSEGFYQGFRKLADVQRRFPWAQSLVICVYQYSRYRYPEEMRGRYAKAFFLNPEDGKNDGFDQKRFERQLTKLGIRWYGDNAFPLRQAAVEAGLGIIRKNNFLYTEKGSFLNLVGFIIDQKCELIHECHIHPCAPKCKMCQGACKSHALFDAHTMDPTRCISFWTTFGKGYVPEFLEEDQFEEWVCGCDNCQDICPYNRRVNWDEGEDFSELSELAPQITPEQLLKQSDEFIRTRVITKTDHHLQPEDTDALRRTAERALKYQKKHQG